MSNCPSSAGCHENNSKVRLGSRIDWDGPELGPHAQVLADDRHQRHAGQVDEPPRQRGGKASIIDPTDDQMEEVHRDGEVQALLAPADEEPQAQSAAAMIRSLIYIEHTESTAGVVF